MVNLRELKLRNEAKCSCGHDFVANDIIALIKNTDFQFYGGRVGYYSEVQCPKCKKEVVLLLEPYNCTYRIIDIGELSQNCNEFEDISSQNRKDLQKTNAVQVKENIENQKNFQCAKCKREFKTPQALIAHQRSCLKK